MAGSLARLVLLQIGVSVFFAALVGWVLGARVGLALLLGGAAVFIPATLSALRMWVSTAQDPQGALRAQISAQALKWLGTLLVFGGTFLWFRPVPALWVFVGFGLVHLVYWVALLTQR
jgi:ATP synthase protein I